MNFPLDIKFQGCVFIMPPWHLHAFCFRTGTQFVVSMRAKKKKKKKKKKKNVSLVCTLFVSCLRICYALGTQWYYWFTPRLAHCLHIVYDMVRMTRIVPAWACIATTSLSMHEAFVALFGPALSRLTPCYINSRHHISSFIPRFVMDPTRCWMSEKKLLSHKRERVYIISQL